MWHYAEMTKKVHHENRLRSYISTWNQDKRKYALSEQFYDFVSKLLELNPQKWLTAKEALEHPFFTEEPLPCKPNEIPRIEGEAHEYTVRQEIKAKKE